MPATAGPGRDDMRLPFSLTDPTSIGTFFEISGAPSKNARIVTIRPSTVGPEAGWGHPRGRRWVHGDVDSWPHK
jgi:hypothetical protein